MSRRRLRGELPPRNIDLANVTPETVRELEAMLHTSANLGRLTWRLERLEAMVRDLPENAPRTLALLREALGDFRQRGVDVDELAGAALLRIGALAYAAGASADGASGGRGRAKAKAPKLEDRARRIQDEARRSKRKGGALVRHLATRFDVSESTVRRDLRNPVT